MKRVWRGAIGFFLLGLAAAALYLFGLTLTSAAIEVALFVWALVLWIVLEPRRSSSGSQRGPLASRIAGRKLKIDQTGDSATVRTVVGDEVRIRQRSGSK